MLRSFSGCCFVTYYTRRAALEAQNALHNVRTLAGVSIANQLFIPPSNILQIGSKRLTRHKNCIRQIYLAENFCLFCANSLSQHPLMVADLGEVS